MKRYLVVVERLVGIDWLQDCGKTKGVVVDQEESDNGLGEIMDFLGGYPLVFFASNFLSADFWCRSFSRKKMWFSETWGHARRHGRGCCSGGRGISGPLSHLSQSYVANLSSRFFFKCKHICIWQYYPSDCGNLHSLPQRPNVFTQIYLPYLWHFATLLFSFMCSILMVYIAKTNLTKISSTLANLQYYSYTIFTIFTAPPAKVHCKVSNLKVSPPAGQPQSVTASKLHIGELLLPQGCLHQG